MDEEAELLDVGRGAVASATGTAVSRLTGFARLAATAFALGIAETKLTDTYTLANPTPNILYELILGGVLSGVLLRVFVEVRQRDGETEAWLFITRLTKLAMIILTTIAVIGIALSPLIIRAYTFRAPASERGAQAAVGTLLLMMFVPQIVFYGLNTIATAVLRAQRRFAVFMFAPAVNNLIVTAMFVAFAISIPAGDRNLDAIPDSGIVLLGAGTTLGVIALGLIPWIYTARVGRQWIKGSGIADPRYGRLARLSAYTLGYVAVNQIGLYVTIALANQIQGGVAARETAFVFFQLPHGLLAVSISMVLGTSLTERAVAADLEMFSQRLILGLRGIAFVILPAAAGYLALAPEIVRYLLEHGVATEASTELISAVLRGYAVGLIFFSFWHLLLGAYQGLGDTRTPFLINLAALAFLLVVGVGLFAWLDDPVDKVVGLAIGHATSYLVAFIIGLRILHRRVGGLNLRPLAATAFKSAGASLVVASTAVFLAGASASLFGDTSLGERTTQILISVGGSLLMYLGVARAIKMEEAKWISGVFTRRATKED